MWINHVNIRYKKPDKEFGVVPFLIQIRVLVGFFIAILTVLLDYEDIVSQVLTLLPYAAFAICMVLFYKRRINFRLWFINGVILSIGVKCYLSSPQIYMIVLDAILIILLYVSPFIKEHYKRKGEVEEDISNV
jgi:hypothetical protein